MSKLHHYLFIALAIVAVVVSAAALKEYGKSNTAQTVVNATDSLTIRDAVVRVEVVSTPEAMQKGLSGRASLADGTGMFFVFEKSDYFGIWMPDMHFPIDVLWFDEGMHVVYIVENMSPDSYPKVFTPTAPTRYILEVPAGFVKAHGIQLGDEGELVTQEKIL
jgi:uncharacterized membrane protein (UPF0127 family)